MSKSSINTLAAFVGLVMVAGFLASCGSSGNTVQLGGDVEALQSLLQADPRYADSKVVVELGNDSSGKVIEWVEIILPDSKCPAPNATACADVINEAVRVILTAPTIDAHPGIQVTVQSFLPKRDIEGKVIKPGKPPLAQHTLDEWRDLLKP
jgi:hypothetical protein